MAILTPLFTWLTSAQVNYKAYNSFISSTYTYEGKDDDGQNQSSQNDSKVSKNQTKINSQEDNCSFYSDSELPMNYD